MQFPLHRVDTRLGMTAKGGLFVFQDCARDSCTALVSLFVPAL